MVMLSDQFDEPEQLRMFMTPREIVGRYSPVDPMAQKLNESVGSGLHASIHQHGVQSPIEVAHDDEEILDGHHRLASSLDTHPDQLVPVRHFSTFWDYHSNFGRDDRIWPSRGSS